MGLLLGVHADNKEARRVGEERRAKEVAERCRGALDKAGQALERMRSQARQWNALAAEAADYKAKANALEDQLAQHLAGAGALRQRVAELEEALAASQRRVGVLESDLDEARRETRAMHARRQEDQRVLERLRHALGDAETMVAPVFAPEDAANADPAGELVSVEVLADYVPRKVSQPRMGEWLKGMGRLTQEALGQALEVQRGSHERLGRILVRMGAVSEADVAECLSHQYGIPLEPLNGRLEPGAEAIEALPARAARAHCCFPLRLAGRILAVAMANPQDLVALDEIRRLTGREVKVSVAPQDAVLVAIDRWYGSEG